MHLTDEELNEYLDDELNDHAQVELHLSSCRDCAARLAALRALFETIESVEEVPLARNLASPITRRLRGNALPRSLRLAVALQALIAMIMMILALPFAAQFISPYLLRFRAPYPVEIFLYLQTQWRSWLDLRAQIPWPPIPHIEVFELSSFLMALVVVVVSLLWLIGNGLLLRNQTR